VAAEAERFAERVRDLMNGTADVSPGELFDHVYAEPTAALEQQRADLLAELRDGEDGAR
jgi:pyruvate dehydrogenase E1 component alpha subunit